MTTLDNNLKHEVRKVTKDEDDQFLLIEMELSDVANIL